FVTPSDPRRDRSRSIQPHRRPSQGREGAPRRHPEHPSIPGPVSRTRRVSDVEPGIRYLHRILEFKDRRPARLSPKSQRRSKRISATDGIAKHNAAHLELIERIRRVWIMKVEPPTDVARRANSSEPPRTSLIGAKKGSDNGLCPLIR